MERFLKRFGRRRGGAPGGGTGRRRPGGPGPDAVGERGADEALVREVAALVIGQAAPHESVAFHAESTAYFADPEGTLDAARARSIRMGAGPERSCGAAEPVETLSPYALAVVGAVLRPMVEDLVRSAAVRDLAGARAAVRGRWARTRSEPDGTTGTDAADAAGSPEAADPGGAGRPDAAAVAAALEQAGHTRRRVWQAAYDEGLRLGLDDRGARRLADALAEGLDDRR
ncbi:hypothetical protein [Streptomyces sp. DH12]|uniref:hypothetical protein n=1 Tax=Streptomyces sp. DH12 TaxID=2857010 RepID=UPI001E4E00E0|nr:hypothetical protein [Streptomyces sp. DH12]